ncbi:MAG: DEAD/DEAH box helicase [Candidatus Helarchaeota archaeon]|nr:DEAD/DEAH box helicase [Candidatus Helarchaeota archaeon]
MKDIRSKFNVLVLPPKKAITDLRVLLFKLPVRGQKVSKLTAFRNLRVKLEYRNETRLRPIKIEYKQHGTQFLQSKDFIKLLRQAKNVYIAEDEKRSLDNVCEMLNDYQISYKKIEICRLCMLDNKITFLQKTDRYYRSREVAFPMCLQCAMKEVMDESTFRAFKPNKKFLNRIEGLLRKKFHHNVNKILKVFEPGFDASKNPEFTLYDIIKASRDANKEFDIRKYNLPQKFLDILKKENFTHLLSIQNLAIQNGLLRNENLLISAPTGTGKTLIGELAGISNLFKRERGKLLYLANLVALVNQKYENFKNRYKQFNVAIRVGMSKIDIGDEDLVIVDEDIHDADIICASYEAFDFLLRQGKEEVENIGKISTIIIDEIQTLEDEERGAILAGLIAKVFILFPEAQIIGLSATIGNAQEVGKLLHLKPTEYYERPVPLERHLVLCKSEYDKFFNIIRLARHESKQVSRYGFHGSTLIFTNARWRCEFLANLLREKGINAAAYHSGLTYNNRKDIELSFDQGLIQAICTTFALGAGFDTPCSQVIFESCLMGIEVLTPNMFLNMSGRAGRFRRQERGKIVLLVEIGKNYHRSNKTEDQIALDLLESDTENLILDYTSDLIQSQVLAAIAAGIDTRIKEFYNYLVGAREEINLLLQGLKKRKLIEVQQSRYHVTTLGRAIALSFFSVEEGSMIVKELHRGEDPLNIAIHLEFFENVYITDEVKKIFLDEFKIKLPNKFITGRIMGIAASIAKFKRRLRRFTWLAKSIALWQKAFFSCNCGNAPYCDCPLLSINKKLIDLRMTNRLTPKQIGRHMERKYNLKVYSGDLLRFFDNLIHRLQGIGRIAKVIGEQEINEKISILIHMIEKPS